MTITLTDQLAAAEAELHTAERRARRTADLDPLTAARARVDELRTRQAAIDATRRDRPAAEKAAAGLVKRAGADLAASRAAVAAAVRDAQRALIAVVRTARAHDALVDQVAGQLRGAGLVAVTEHGDEYPTGAGEGCARIAGRWWNPAHADTVLAYAVHTAARHLFGDRSELVRRTRGYRSADYLPTRGDALLGDVPALAPYVDPSEVSLAAEMAQHRADVRAWMREDQQPSAHAADMAERDRKLTALERQGWEARARPAYAAARAELVRKHGADHAAAIERGDVPA